MKLAEARRLLKKHCRHSEEWRCGGAVIRLTGWDPSYPRFDRCLDVYLDLKPYAVDVAQIARLLNHLDTLGRVQNLGGLGKSRKVRTRRAVKR